MNPSSTSVQTKADAHCAAVNAGGMSFSFSDVKTLHAPGTVNGILPHREERKKPRNSARLSATSRGKNLSGKRGSGGFGAYETEPEAVWGDQVEAELQNWRAALQWALGSRGDVLVGQRLVGSLMYAWYEFATVQGRQWVSLALELVDEKTPS